MNLPPLQHDGEPTNSGALQARGLHPNIQAERGALGAIQDCEGFAPLPHALPSSLENLAGPNSEMSQCVWGMDRGGGRLTRTSRPPGETGTIVSDFLLRGEAFEDDLDPMSVVEIEPRCHPLVLHDAALGQSWSPEASQVKAKVDAGHKPRFERGGTGKAYGKAYIGKQFKSLDLSLERMKAAKVGEGTQGEGSITRRLSPGPTMLQEAVRLPDLTRY